MDKKVLNAIKKITKVIKMFEQDVVLLSENKKPRFDEKGKLIKTPSEIKIRMAIMTPKNKYYLDESIRGTSLSDTKEGYYILKENDDFKISENSLLKCKDKIYKVIKVEENYGIFLRMELNIDDKRD
jgi:hypothetical protein